MCALIRPFIWIFIVIVIVANVDVCVSSSSSSSSSAESSTSTSSRGWGMTDRFLGFRFEISLDHNHGDIDHDHDNDDGNNDDTKALMDDIVAKADEQFCFGWVQHYTKRNTVVGEARCTKRNGWMLKRHIMESIGTSTTSTSTQHGAKEERKMDSSNVIVKDYDDTKIKLHFSHFKILDSDRETCFRDEPHQCTDKELLVPMW